LLLILGQQIWTLSALVAPTIKDALSQVNSASYAGMRHEQI